MMKVYKKEDELPMQYFSRSTPKSQRSKIRITSKCMSKGGSFRPIRDITNPKPILITICNARKYGLKNVVAKGFYRGANIYHPCFLRKKVLL